MLVERISVIHGFSNNEDIQFQISLSNAVIVVKVEIHRSFVFIMKNSYLDFSFLMAVDRILRNNLYVT